MSAVAWLGAALCLLAGAMAAAGRAVQERFGEPRRWGAFGFGCLGVTQVGLVAMLGGLLVAIRVSGEFRLFLVLSALALLALGYRATRRLLALCLWPAESPPENRPEARPGTG